MTPAEVETTPVSMLTIDEIVEHLYRRDGVRAYGIDTGACFGGHLTAAVYDPHTKHFAFFQEPAARAYASMDLNGEA